MSSSTLPDEVICKLSGMMDSSFPVPQLIPGGADLLGGGVQFEQARPLLEAIDGYLQQYPATVDLLLAKASVLRLAQRDRQAEELVAEVLTRDPGHFDAGMMREDWNIWPHLLQLPSCAEDIQRLAPALVAGLREGHIVQPIRDGLSPSVAFFRDISEVRFDHGLSNTMRCQWDFVPADTPHGRIVAHYVLVEGNAASPYREEFFLPTGKPDRAGATTGYWLLQRLARLDSAFLVFAKGDDVRYVRRYVFPPALRQTLARLVEQMDRDPLPTVTTDDFQRAVQWHTNHFDFESVKFHAAVSAPMPPPAPSPQKLQQAETRPALDYRCAICGRQAKPVPTSAANVMIATVDQLPGLLFQCQDCRRLLCGRCLHSSVGGGSFGVFNSCPLCQGSLGPVEGIDPRQAARLEIGQEGDNDRTHEEKRPADAARRAKTDQSGFSTTAVPASHALTAASQAKTESHAEPRSVPAKSSASSVSTESPAKDRVTSDILIGFMIILILLGGLNGFIIGAVQFLVEHFFDWTIGTSFLMHASGAAIMASAVAAALAVLVQNMLNNKVDDPDAQVKPFLRAGEAGLFGALLGSLAGWFGWTHSLLAPQHEFHLPTLLAHRFGIRWPGFWERAGGSAASLMLVFAAFGVVGAAGGIAVGRVKSPSLRLLRTLLLLVPLLSGIYWLVSNM